MRFGPIIFKRESGSEYELKPIVDQLTKHFICASSVATNRLAQLNLKVFTAIFVAIEIQYYKPFQIDLSLLRIRPNSTGTEMKRFTAVLNLNNRAVKG